jgi:hypothetical protein
MAYEMTGKIKKIFDQQDFPSGFYKQEFVVTTDEKFPQDVKLSCLKEKVEALQNFKEGDSVQVSFNVNGREWNEKYFVDLTAWKIDAAGAQAPKGPAVHEQVAPAEDPGDYTVDDEDIPF